MDIKDEYMHLTYDLAGSQTKNRFRQELLWGISVALDNLTNEDWNAVVFDYVCDIELHYNNRLELHQLKVNKSQKNLMEIIKVLQHLVFFIIMKPLKMLIMI